MAIWGSQSIQFGWFVTSVDGLKADVLYEGIVGHEPDHAQRNKVPNPAAPFFSVASGALDGLQRQLQVQPGRIDLLISGEEEGGGVGNGPQLLDTRKVIEETVHLFDKRTIVWPDAVRLTVVANLFWPAADAGAATEKFFEVTGLNFGLNDMTDPMLQINRRKPLKSLPVEMNRVMRFGTASFQEFVVQFQDAKSMPVPISVQHFGASLTLDFNTAPDGRVFQVKDQVSICKELAEELLRVAEAVSPAALEQ